MLCGFGCYVVIVLVVGVLFFGFVFGFFFLSCGENKLNEQNYFSFSYQPAGTSKMTRFPF